MSRLFPLLEGTAAGRFLKETGAVFWKQTDKGREAADDRSRKVRERKGMGKNWKMRMAGLVLAALIGIGTLLGSGVDAKAAGVIAKGIDVSMYQEAINWSAVASEGYSFAFIRVGSAKSGLDPYFAQNMAGAAAAGLKTGVYLYSYATTVEAALAEAQFTLAAIAPFTVNMPVVYDLEDAVHKTMSTQELVALVVAFCSTIENAGYYPMVYSNKNMLTTQIGVVPYDVWVAQYADACEYPNPSFWQFTSSGTVSGINGRVDLNYQFKDYSNIIIANGFTTRNGNTYFYNNYKMQRGWVDYEGNRYFMNADGTLFKNGWLTDGVNTWYMDTSDGHMLRDLVTIAGKNYYFDVNGLMQTGLVNIGGLTYLFGADGSMQYGWYTDVQGLRYFQEDGSMAVNKSLVLDGKTYVFDANGIGTEYVAPEIDLTGIDPSTWVLDPSTGNMIDSATGLPVDPAVAAAVIAQAQAVAAQ